MVFFFIAYLIIIFLICFPFRIKVVAFYASSRQIRYFCAQIGFFRFCSKKRKKIKSKKHRKLRLPVKIRLNKIRLKRPIDYKIKVYATRPKAITSFERKLFGASFVKIGKTLDFLLNNADVIVTDNEDDIFFIQFDASIKTNLFLIFSSVLQTISLRRN